MKHTRRKIEQLATSQMAGLGLLTVTGAVGLWSATNSSVFALKNWAKTPETKKNARSAMNLGLVSIALLSAGSYFLTKNTPISVATLIIGILLYAHYDKIIRENPTLPEPETISGYIDD